MDELVDNAQAAFIHGVPSTLLRNFSGNMLGKRGYSRCTLKVVIQKAFDNVKWDFLREGLQVELYHFDA